MYFRTYIEGDADFVLKIGKNKNMSAQAMVAELHSRGTPNFLNHAEVVIGGVAIEAVEAFGTVWLKSIRSIEMKNGAGTRLMQLIALLADKHHVVVRLTPKPFGPGAPSVDKLIQFYRRFGFEGDKNLMIRDPD